MGSTLRRIARHYGAAARSTTAGANFQTAADASLSLGSGDWTVRAWVRLSLNGAGSTAVLLGLYSAVYNDGILLYTNSGLLIPRAKDSTIATIAAAPLLGDWHLMHIVGTASTRKFEMFIDGLSVGVSPGTWAAGAFPGTMRAYVGDGANVGFAGGSVADYVIDVGHAWSASDVLTDYVTGNPPATHTHRWPLDDGSGVAPRATRGGLAMTFLYGVSMGWTIDAPDKARDCVQNHVAQSENLAAAVWTKSNVTTSAYGGALPAGVSAMTTITDSNPGAGVTSHYAIQTTSGVVVGEEQIVSFYAAVIAGSGIFAVGPDGGNFSASINLNTGVVQSVSAGILASGCEATNAAGVYRCWVKFRASASPGSTYLQLTNGASGNYTANGQAVALGGVMQERCVPGQTTPSPYVATGDAPLSVYVMRERRQNWLSRSDDVSQTAYWSRTNILSVTTDGTIAPDGTTMQKVVESVANATHIVAQTPSTNIPSKSVRTIYAVVKSAGRQWVALFTDNANQGAMFDIVNGVVGSVTFAGAAGGTPRIRSLGGGFWLISITCDASTSGVASYALYMSTGSAFGSLTYAGDGVSGVYVGRTGMAQTDDVPTHISTTTAPKNSNGAPRSSASGRGTFTNLALQSDHIDTAPWALTNATAPAYGGALPAGVSQIAAARVLTDNAANALHYSAQVVSTAASGVLYELSFYAKPMAGSGWVCAEGAQGAVWYNLNAGSVAVGKVASGTNGARAANADDSPGGGWVRCSMLVPWSSLDQHIYVFTATGNGTTNSPSGDASTTYAGSGAQQVAICGVQLELAEIGQTTPSPLAASGASAGTGLRDYRQNRLLRSARPDLSPWIAATATPPTIVTGLADPKGGTSAFSLQDSSATEFQGSEQLFLGASSGFMTHTTNVYVKKTVGATNTVGIAFVLYGGTGVSVGARLNPNTGVATVGTVVDAGAWWLWSVSVTNNGTNPNLALTLYPAPGTIAGGDSVAATGTTIFALPRVFDGSGPWADHVETTTSQYNTNGAPRSIAA